MKKVLLSLAVVAGLGMSSCGSASIEDVKVADIKDACGCADAINTVSGIMVATAEKFDKDADKLEEDEAAKKVMDSGMEKIEEVMSHCMKELDVKKSDLEECDSFESADKNMDIIKDM